MPAKKKSPAATSSGLLVPEKIAPLVHVLRHEKVILDSDLAELYGVTTGNLNKAVQRNIERFPADFMFQVTVDELEVLKSQYVGSTEPKACLQFQTGMAKNAESYTTSDSATSKDSRGGRRSLP